MRTTLKWTIATVVIAIAFSASSAVVAAKDIVGTAVDAGSFNTLAAALKAAGLVDALQGKGPFTVFAPTDDAFAKLPAGTVETLLRPENKQKLVDILTYHVVPGNVLAADVVKLTGATSLNGQRIDIATEGGKVTVDQANVVQTDIECDNGVIHVIDSVILPASDDLPTTASNAGAFNTLLAAAKAAGLVDALSGDEPLTVFAPTDGAFEKLPQGTVETLLKPENKAKLASILKYHVIPGRVYSDAALAAGQATTLQGGKVKITATADGAKVNDANLIKLDIDSSNGVIHVIDAVILPPANSQSSNQTPRKMIETAIAHGAPLYNAGQADACAKVYMTTLEQVLAMEGHGLCSHTVETMQTALNKAQHTSCSNTQAWTLRKALDVAYNSAR